MNFRTKPFENRTSLYSKVNDLRFEIPFVISCLFFCFFLQYNFFKYRKNIEKKIVFI